MSERTKAELLDRAIELSLEQLVERMENGEYISSGELSFLNSLAKTSNIKPIVEEKESMEFSLSEKIRGLIVIEGNEHSQHFEEVDTVKKSNR